MSDFIGRYLNKVDKKGRVSVPASWRSNLISKEFAEYSNIQKEATNFWINKYVDS